MRHQGVDTLLDWCRARYGVRRLCDISWAHAVNSRERLLAALSRDAMMVECDVLTTGAGDIMLAHSPGDASDMLLLEVLDILRDERVGLKVDMKEPSAVYPTLDSLSRARLTCPVILNADILNGPGGRPALFEPGSFISACKEQYEAGILSVGWTTTSDTQEVYTEAQVSEMLALCRDCGSVAFPVRADLLPRSWPALSRLYSHEGAMLSLWGDIAEDGLAWLDRHLPDGNYLFDCALI
ncbi:MAG: DUF2181 domain-containing protein [Chloroflexota bacterium]